MDLLLLIYPGIGVAISKIRKPGRIGIAVTVLDAFTVV